MTVLITVKNGSKTIKKCIDSVLKLNYPKNRYKVFVVDAFSTDGTFEILKSYGSKITLKQKRGFPPAAYNYAVKSIKTDLVAFTNADCTVNGNWLKEIVKPFEDDVVAVAGIAVNPPRTENKLQEIIGIELEDRYKHFPKQIQRAPEMNLCVRTDVLRKVRFDEKMPVSYDADFGYRINRYGKILYSPKAIVYHYHRASWYGFFKQQNMYAKFVPITYLKKHKSKMIGDNVSKTLMLVQIILLYASLLFLLLNIFQNFVNLFLITFSLLVLTYVFEALRLRKEPDDLFWFLALFFVRNVAWNTGLIVGIYNVIRY